MKKKMYYVIPFKIVPCSMLFMELLDNLEILNMSPYIMGGVLLVISAMMGFFSHTHRTFDYLMTALMPLSLFLVMFVIGFLDKSDLGTRFHLYRAVDVSLQPTCILLYFLMALMTFLGSYKKFRDVKNR